MAKKSQTPPPAPEQDNDDTIHIDVDFNFKFNVSPQAKQLLQGTSQALKWLLPLLVAFSTVRSEEREPIQVPQNLAPAPIDAEQNPKVNTIKP